MPIITKKDAGHLLSRSAMIPTLAAILFLRGVKKKALDSVMVRVLGLVKLVSARQIKIFSARKIQLGLVKGKGRLFAILFIRNDCKYINNTV